MSWKGKSLPSCEEKWVLDRVVHLWEIKRDWCIGWVNIIGNKE